MNILSVAWNVFDVNGDIYTPQKNGGSIMIAQICEYIGRLENSYLYVGNQRMSGANINHIVLLDNDKYIYFERNPETIDRWQECLLRRFMEHVFELDIDVVLFHGDGEFVYNCVNFCVNNGIQCATVNHLYIGKECHWGARYSTIWQNKILSIPGIEIITVGHEMKNEILRDFEEIKEDKVTVIVNGTAIEVREKKKNNLGKKVLLCVGTLQPRKNQKQLIRSISLLPDSIRKQIEVRIIGQETGLLDKEELIKYIEDLNVDDCVTYLGAKPSEFMSDVYAEADGLISASIIEGVSLVVLEAITYGQPVIMFKDNETSTELSDDRVSVIVDIHSDEALSNGIIKWLNTEWDNSYIRNYSKYYCMERVGREYVDFCKRISKK